MKFAVVLSAVAATAAAAVSTTACAHAQPEPPPSVPPPLPQVGAACAEHLDGALTELPAPADAPPSRAKNLLECADGSWQTYRNPYPSPQSWLTTGPELVLSGMRNPEIGSGTWTGTPQFADGQCEAQQVEVVAAGQTSAPQAFTAEPGAPLTVPVSDRLFTLRLSGYCLWQRAD
ncbi:hypothetical protein MCHIJ_33530 [Mycolicibacterium chitae]|uniref:Secreted protein n=1 Tax=Mycolicibacterium chitae TaxID=1792 RepID=A0A3S4T015_MYCCI|nr:hypothetical protein [Mycolicibacterium chitae]MCV7106913.1 hypothetical protein [Mycolicibacterium chitae]BBZ03916.1 hypothetical protein MCHIJ_33530 [Mycolicibacterium chitae]VEG47567.1 Uncharacterised protein [Mycolicibacterium chitae]